MATRKSTGPSSTPTTVPNQPSFGVPNQPVPNQPSFPNQPTFGAPTPEQQRVSSVPNQSSFGPDPYTGGSTNTNRLVELGRTADNGDADAQTTLDNLARDRNIDPDEYPTWDELVTALNRSDDYTIDNTSTATIAAVTGADILTAMEEANDNDEDYTYPDGIVSVHEVGPKEILVTVAVGDSDQTFRCHPKTDLSAVLEQIANPLPPNK